MEKDQTNKEEQQVSQFKFIKELATLKYEAEEQRAQSLIKQASQMQAAFSFVMVAVFMAMAILLEYRGELPLNFFFVSLFFIIVFLLASLVLASLAQWRYTRKVLLDIQDINERIINSDNWEKFTDRGHQLRFWIDTVGDEQSSKAKLNKRRMKLVTASMIFLYLAIGSVAISFIVGLIIII